MPRVLSIYSYIHSELWIVVRKTFTQLALPSPGSRTTYHIYAMGWIELYSHNDTGEVLDVPVLQNMYLSQMLELASLYLPLGPQRVRSSVPAVTESYHRDCAGRRMICHLLSCPSTEAVLQTPAMLVWPMRLLWGCEPSYPRSPPSVIVSASFPEERKRKKGNSECQQLRPENPNRIPQDKEKALWQIWNFIPDQFQRAAPDIQSSELPNNNYQMKK